MACQGLIVMMVMMMMMMVMIVRPAGRCHSQDRSWGRSPRGRHRPEKEIYDSDGVDKNPFA